MQSLGYTGLCSCFIRYSQKEKNPQLFNAPIRQQMHRLDKEAVEFIYFQYISP